MRPGGWLTSGGDPAGIDIVELEEVPLAYSGNDSVRIRVKAVSDLLHVRKQSGGGGQWLTVRA